MQSRTVFNIKKWFIGSFIEPTDSLRSTTALEVKWGNHKAGEKREDWSIVNESTTLSLLIRGKITIVLPDEKATLSSEGDYIIIAPGLKHKWVIEEDALVITVRWPSLDESED